PAEDYINHPDHRAAGQAALDAVFPAAEMTLLYPDLAAEGLTGHKVDYVFITFSERANYYVDITTTLDLKIEALRKHASQLGKWDPSPMIRQWAAESGKKVGFAYAEAFYRITLRQVETPAEPQPEV
ncbi:MAG TPA: PIG-L family deacetylase, partial [Promineifilum sp.]|nr:PIG-L family deacetylase [Promineifilum sp.]